MNDNIIELNEKDFTDNVKLKNFDNKLVLIKFYTTWCGYCKRAIPDYKELADKYKNNNRVAIAKMDADKNSQFLEKINKFKNWPGVQGYPTILLFKNNLYLAQYKGDRTVVDYIDFLNKYY